MRTNKTTWYDLNQTVNDLDEETGNIPLSESEKRLNVLLTVSALCLVTLCTSFVVISHHKYQPQKYVYYNNTFGNGDSATVPHIMILTFEGTMHPYTWKSNPKTKGTFPKLPKSVSYGMVSYNKNLYAFSTTKLRGITRIRPNGTSRLIQSKTQDITKGYGGEKVTTVDHYIWLFESQKCDHTNDAFQAFQYVNGNQDMCNQIQRTFLWSIPRKVWIDGPNLPKGLDLRGGCVMTYNRSFVIVIGTQIHQKDWNVLDSEGRVFGYDFRTKVWIPFQSMPSQSLAFNEAIISHISCTIHNHKHSRLVYA